VASGQVDIPDTDAGVVLSAMVSALNSGELEQVEEFERRFDPEGMVNDLTRYHERSGGLGVTSVRDSEQSRIEFLARERATDIEVIGRIEVRESGQPQIRKFFMRSLPPGASEVTGFDVDPETRRLVIDGVIDALQEFYVSPDIAVEMADALTRRGDNGDYDTVNDGVDFASLLTEHLRDVYHDEHLVVVFGPAPFPSGPNPSAVTRYQRQMEWLNCELETVSRLLGNVGYLKLNAFPGPVCEPAIASAMNVLERVGAIIVDLRDNGGGNAGMVALLSTYLLADRTHLNSMWIRATDQTQESWTVDDDISGKRLGEIPVYVLTSDRTFSAAEEFAYNLQSLERARIVGEATRGGAHIVRTVRLDDQFLVVVPFGRAINPITNDNWEGEGVQPDVPVSEEDALDVALRLAQEAVGF
jgi:hypothetical protein